MKIEFINIIPARKLLDGKNGWKIASGGVEAGCRRGADLECEDGKQWLALWDGKAAVFDPATGCGFGLCPRARIAVAKLMCIMTGER